MRDDRTRIGILTGADLRRGAAGGTRSYVLGLVRFLADEGLGVEIVANGPADDLPQGVTATPVSREHVASTLAFQRALRSWSAREDFARFALLHLQRPDDLTALRLQGGCPVVCTLHGDAARGIRRRRGRVAKAAYLRRERWAVSRFAALIAVDPSTADLYAQRYPAASERLHTIPVAVEDSFARGPEPGPRHDGHVFLFVGRLSVEKRVDRIIQAVRSSGIPDARLTIAGTGPELSRLVRAATGAAVEFLGEVPHDTLPALYQTADALVLASEYEGLPTVALEALANGCPVVAPAGCGLEAVVTDGRGILVPSLDAFPQALREVVKLRDSGQRITLPQEYTWSRVGGAILAVYRSVVPEGVR